MKVIVKLFGLLPNRFPNYEPKQGMEIELPDGAKVKDLFALLDISESEKGIVTVDSYVQKMESELKDGSKVLVFHLVPGG